MKTNFFARLLMEEELYGLYDRQIRLFGRDTQALIEDSHVFITQGPRTYATERSG